MAVGRRCRGGRMSRGTSESVDGGRRDRAGPGPPHERRPVAMAPGRWSGEGSRPMARPPGTTRPAILGGRCGPPPRRSSAGNRRYPRQVAASDLLYRVYERSLVRELAGAPMPQHVGVILDGNRRFARERGLAHVADGHLAGAQRIEPFLGWCAEIGIPNVTLWLLSTDNLDREDDEVAPLLRIIEDTVHGLACGEGNADPAVAGHRRRRARPAADRDPPAAEGGRGVHSRPRGDAGPDRGRVRRPPGDHRRAAVAAARRRRSRSFASSRSPPSCAPRTSATTSTPRGCRTPT